MTDKQKQQADYEAFEAYEADLLMLKGEASSLDEAKAKIRKTWGDAHTKIRKTWSDTRAS